MNDRLYRSRDDRVISGVAGGLAERLDVDPSIVRVAWVILAVLSGGLLALVYLVMMVVVPEAPFDAPGRSGGVDPWSTPAATGVRPAVAPDPTGASDQPVTHDPAAATDPEQTAPFTATGAPAASTRDQGTWLPPDGRSVPHSDPGAWAAPRERRNERGGGLVLGFILILVGAYFLIREYVPQVDLDATWPVLVVGAGVVLVVFALLPDRSRH